MVRRPPRTTRTDPRFPYTRLCRSLRMDAAAIGGEPIPGERRGGGARRAIIDHIGPEPRLCGAALAGHEHRHRRVVGVELGGLQSFLADAADRSEEHTSELPSLMRISYAVFCLKKTK